MLTLSQPRKLNGKFEIDDTDYELLYAVEDIRTYMFSINEKGSRRKPRRMYILTIYRDYVTIDDLGEDIYNSVGRIKIIKVQLETNDDKVIHMIGLNDIKNIQKFRIVIEGMIIGLNEKIDNQNVFPPLNQWNGYTPISHSTSHGVW